MSDVTRILYAIEDGDPQRPTAASARLRRVAQLARQKLAQEHLGQTLQATALVHEAYLRLVDAPTASAWTAGGTSSRRAAEAMRRILIDRRRTNSVGSAAAAWYASISMDGRSARRANHRRSPGSGRGSEQAARQDPLKAELVKLRFFAGLTAARGRRLARHIAPQPRTASGPMRARLALRGDWQVHVLRDDLRSQNRDGIRLISALNSALGSKSSEEREATCRHGELRSSWRPWSKSRPRSGAAYLDEACGDRTDLRRRVEGLLHPRRSAAGSRRSAGATPRFRRRNGRRCGGPGSARLIPEGPGSRIGPYKLLEQIGEGGMGMVCMAEQEQPVHRKVALKIIKPGMDTAQVHRSLRGGTPGAGHDGSSQHRPRPRRRHHRDRPALFRHGIGQRRADHRLTATRNKLTPRERLELFVQVCQAVQHAHQRASSTATSSRPTCWSPSTTASRCRR